jgi:hypothetical protein
MKLALSVLLCTACVVQTPAYVSLASRTAEQVDSRAIDATDAERKVFRGGHDDMGAGFGGTFEQLELYLAGK